MMSSRSVLPTNTAKRRSSAAAAAAAETKPQQDLNKARRRPSRSWRCTHKMQTVVVAVMVVLATLLLLVADQWTTVHGLEETTAAATAAKTEPEKNCEEQDTTANGSTAPTCNNSDANYVSSSSSSSTTTTTTTTPPNKFCNLWKHMGEFPYDVVAASSDVMWGEGRGEDVALLRALRKLGRKVSRVSIQDYDFDWTTQTKSVIIRSAWDKYDWIDDYWQFQKDRDQHAMLLNPLEVLQWSAQKDVYLQQLKAKGIPMVDTVYISYDDIEERWERMPSVSAKYYYDSEGEIMETAGPAVFKSVFADVRRILGGCDDVIIKPANGNGAVGVRRWPQDDEEEWAKGNGGNGDFWDQFRILVAAENEVVMFQCFQRQILTKGERGIIFVGGEVTHGLLKMPQPTDEDSDREHFVVNTDFGGSWEIYQPTKDEVDFAKQVAAAVADSVGVWPAYLRVDIFYDNDDNLALMELAAGTANIWLEQVPDAADALARYIDSQLTKIETECAAYLEQDQQTK